MGGSSEQLMLRAVRQAGGAFACPELQPTDPDNARGTSSPLLWAVAGALALVGLGALSLF
jgi:hypothetical protein